MAAHIPARLSRFAIPAIALLLATAGLAWAASSPQSPASATKSAQAPAVAPTVVVPEVTGQAYVFAKGILEDAGFAWKVEGGVNGFAANLVASQSPTPGTRLVDTGTPTISLELNRNGKYAEEGVPENFAPYGGTPVVRPSGVKRPVTKPAARPKPAVKRPVKPAAKKPVVKRPQPAPKAAEPKPQVKKVAARPAAFTVPSAPKEPLNEMPLPRRAQLLSDWVTKHPRPTDANVAHWLYQHSWIVTGAKFGWWHGAEALQTLIAVDERAIESWGIGARSRSQARTALAEVEARGG